MQGKGTTVKEQRKNICEHKKKNLTIPQHFHPTHMFKVFFIFLSKVYKPFLFNFYYQSIISPMVYNKRNKAH